MDAYEPDEEIDALCDEFEQRLAHKESPQAIEFIERIDPQRQPQLLYWLLTLQMQAREASEEQRREALANVREQLPQFAEAVDAAERSLGLTPPSMPKIPEYTMRHAVQRGGQGEVFAATQDRTGQNVAIKLVRDRDGGGLPANIIERVKTETMTLAILDHPNIVKVFDAGVCDDGIYLVMQWVGGGSLADSGMETKSRSQVEAAGIIRTMAEALRKAHASGILHLDVKPQNILIDQDTQQPLLADFGLAQISGADDGYRAAVSGTPGYMAPEQAMGGALDERTDVYGLGATFYRLLTGRSVYEDVSLPFDPSEREAWNPVAPRELCRDINPELERICLKCVAFAPEDRYQNCGEVRAALDRFAQTEDGRRIARMSARTLATSPLFLLINLAVLLQLRAGWADNRWLEPLIWATMFSMYGVVFYVFGSVSKLDRHSPEHLALESLWAIWLAKFFAAIAIAGSLRLMVSGASSSPSVEGVGGPQTAILMCYPMFATLTGFVLAAIAPRYWRALYGLAAVTWLLSLALMGTIVLGYSVAPAIYGGGATGIAVIWGAQLRRLAREQAKAAPSANITMTSDWRVP